MYTNFNIVKKIFKYWLFSFFSLFLLSWVSSADLLWDVTEDAHRMDLMVNFGKSVNIVWKTRFEWSTEVSADFQEIWISKKPSTIVKLTRLLLSLVVALSITMILYNGLKYIIETWQWKESKDLAKNLIFIVVWILIALFSVAIITVIQSVSTTLDQETSRDIANDNTIDTKLVEGERKWISRKSFFNL